jgi:methylated-DNA-[protein]-cysteine S-methyltransferase
MWTTYDSPVGTLTLIAGEAGLRGLCFPERPPQLAGESEPDALAPVTAQLDEYFAGARRAFDVDLDLRGSELQLEVWAALREIPWGTTVAYGELAARVGRAGHEHVRAVAGCVARTPVPIIVGCHRVIGADGSLTGYGGGLARKRALLDHEGAFAQLSLIR